MQGWLYRDRIVVTQDTGNIQRAERVPFDLRAMRKIDGSEPFIVFDNTPLSGTAVSVTVSGIVRMLYLRPG